MIDETREPQPNTDSRGRRRNRNRRKKGRGARWWKKQSRNLQIPISRSCVIPFFCILERDSGLGSLAWTPATRHFEKLRSRSKRRQDNKWFGIISMLLCLHFVDGVNFELFSCENILEYKRHFLFDRKFRSSSVLFVNWFLEQYSSPQYSIGSILKFVLFQNLNWGNLLINDTWNSMQWYKY